MRVGIKLEEAQTLLLERISTRQECNVPLIEAVDHILSADITAAIDLPPFNKSPLDGYALKAGDTRNASRETPAELEIIEEIRAGFVADKKVVAGTAVKLMTGAPIPCGADVVVKYEDVQRDGNIVKIFSPLTANSNIILAGEDVVKGETLAKRGDLITPALVGLLAGVGIDKVPVFKKAKVAIASTGDELISPGLKLQPGKIYNSNLYALHACCAKLGACPIVLDNLPDEREAIANQLAKALAKADIIITTGGVSVGDYDLILESLKMIGAKAIFWKIDTKPGSPVVAAELNNKLIIGLSGNPAAAFITFELIAAPVIRKMQGFSRLFPVRTTAVMLDDFKKASPQRRFLRGQIKRENHQNYIKLTGQQTNSVLKSLVNYNALVDIPAGSGPLVKGQEVSVSVLENYSKINFYD